MSVERYARQVVFGPIGREGQDTLLRSKVTIIGMGALGTVLANCLCRSGVGHIRMVDRDYVELSNLQRQLLYDEDDAAERLPKAIAAYRRLSAVNSEITLEPLVSDVNPANIGGLLSGADLVLDATDNWETRFLINEACSAYTIPWIYCGALGGTGMTMNILPKDGGPCLRCLMQKPAAPSQHSCSTYGVMNMVTNAIASAQAAEAIKLLTGSGSVRQGLLVIDLWENHFDVLPVPRDGDCPVCVHKRYEYFGRASASSYATAVCGSDSIQVVPAAPRTADFQDLSERLKKIGTVRFNQFTLIFSDGRYEITLFQDGRAMIKNAIDGSNAKSVYAEYIGL